MNLANIGELQQIFPREEIKKNNNTQFYDIKLVTHCEDFLDSFS